MENQMFCYQCQETAGGKGCTAGGMCGKKPATAHLQDVLIYVTKGLAELATAYRREGHAVSSDVTHMLEDNLFVTITNANFDDDFITARIEDTEKAKEALRQLLPKDFSLSEAALPLDMASTAGNPHIGVLSEKDENKRSLLELITYGLKGLSAYLRHARVLQKESEEISNFLAEALAKTLKQDLTLDDLLALTMKTGEMGVKGMALLDEANTGAYGQPEITEVDIDSFIRAKGAIFSAIRTMLSYCDFDISMIENVYVAGGIGSGINMANAINIGMFPDIPVEMYHYVGNTSLAGAYAMLCSTESERKVYDLAANMTYIELSTIPQYMDEFVGACFLPHTDASLFPNR